MELAELIGLRPVPAAGLLLTLTRRCPLRCAHCSTGSAPETRERPEPGLLRRFVGSFGPADRPEVMMLTGGEPLLLPRLVADLSASARAAGTRTAVLSGMFFARAGATRSRPGPSGSGSRVVPASVLRALTAVDHFSASLDVHHEREVPRSAVFRALREIREAGTAVSLHLTGDGPDDPYLADVTRAIDREFDGTVPALVNEVRAVGRAASWAGPVRYAAAAPSAPCAMAAWPVVAFDGTVLACCNQDVVDRRPAPAHLTLGHLADDDWASVRARTLGSPLLRLVRAMGAPALRERYLPDAGPAASPCAECRGFADRPEATAGAAAGASGAAGALLDLTVARRRADLGPVELVRHYGCAPYAPWVLPRASRTTAPGLPRTSAKGPTTAEVFL
ncbi:radical SAM protein [Streptomyces sp. R302]|uniref:radical SAM protein n=1 Tax=unclassified Streptomyces TaxID=2593676 RepID=UPI00145D4D94|nr:MULTISPECIES: radical SAM protein [unclassified Streptomyces]NML51050.1 radical SAM protein [Streptomyces sp. R301]NML81145.1 radical SAM protein [Streptomyces sp. R302]